MFFDQRESAFICVQKAFCKVINGVGYFRNWFAVYSFTDWPVSILTYYLYVAGLIAAIFMREDKELGRRSRAEAENQNDKYDLVIMRIFTGRPHTPRNCNIPHYNEC